MAEIVLSEDQQAGYDALTAFYESTEQDKMFCLKGYAGTGKTTLLTKFVTDILSKKPVKDESVFSYTPTPRVAMTAPTNKAVQVLREFSTRNDITFKTIHSLLKLKEVITDSGEIKFEQAFDEDGTDIRSFTILIVDEVSMLDDYLFYKIRAYNNDCKIIFTGDPCQIPPVNRQDCEVFLRPQEHGIIEYQLTKIMRQANGSSIIANSFKIRDDLHNEEFQFEGGGDLTLMSPVTERNLIRDRFFSTFTSVEVSDKTKVIAWTNKKVDEYNQYIRGILFGPNIPKLMEGERLVMNSPCECDWEDKKTGRKMELLTTNQEVTVKSFTIELTKVQDQQLNCYIANIEFISQMGLPKIGRLKIIHENSQHAFSAELNRIKQFAITGPMSERKFTWKRYYAFLRSVADVKYAYAISCHKSQGSSYDTTFIDVGNIKLNSNVVERNRILYTALTRARKEAVLIV